MKLSWLAILALLAAGWARAQDTGSLEIRGILVETGLNTGVAGAQITVYQFSISSERTVFATGMTDAQGTFLFHPTLAGNYYVEAKKPGYVATTGYEGPTKPLPEETGSVATVNRDHPQEYVRLALMRFAEMTGRVVDENDQPIERILVEALDPRLLTTQERLFQNARTGQDGSFTIKGLHPGQYMVRLSGATVGLSPPTTKFSEEDLNAVGQDVEASYWPGVPDASAAGKVTIVPGAPQDLGTLRMRKGPLYRVRVSVRGCRPGDELKFSLSAGYQALTTFRPDGTSVSYSFAGLAASLSSCDDFLVRDLPPDSYQFALQSKQGWALAPVEIVNKNIVVTIAMGPEADVTGAVIAAHDDMAPPALDRMRIILNALRPLGLVIPISVSTASGDKFSFKGVRGPQHAVIVNGLSNGYYVKEIRSDGVVAPDGIVTLSPGSHIEVVVDDQPATLTGAVTYGGKPFSQPKVFVSRWPVSRPLPGMEGAPKGTGDGAGRFQIAGLPPGEYRVLAVPSGPIPDGASDWTISPQLWDRAEKVTLERGKQTEVALKLTDPILDK